MVSASTLTSWSRLPRSRDRRCRLCREPVRRTLLQPEHTDVFDVVRDLPERRGELLNLMENYLLNGGFPEVAVNNVDPKDYLGILFDSLRANETYAKTI